ncbi:hypothetical protein RRG08_009250 [Elysia crispata]|uniref:Uncharacterized protein n=1 Tax=Elysia crispata TaxID=231223 RepID=A0AAE1AYZ1_9GAST|nr:hypothetical protein RRG08_009250 [Elysia crispata]
MSYRRRFVHIPLNRTGRLTVVQVDPVWPAGVTLHLLRPSFSLSAVTGQWHTTALARVTEKRLRAKYPALELVGLDVQEVVGVAGWDSPRLQWELCLSNGDKASVDFILYLLDILLPTTWRFIGVQEIWCGRSYVILCTRPFDSPHHSSVENPLGKQFLTALAVTVRGDPWRIQRMGANSRTAEVWNFRYPSCWLTPGPDFYLNSLDSLFNRSAFSLLLLGATSSGGVNIRAAFVRAKGGNQIIKLALDLRVPSSDYKIVALDLHVSSTEYKAVALDLHNTSTDYKTVALDLHIPSTDYKTVALNENTK